MKVSVKRFVKKYLVFQNEFMQILIFYSIHKGDSPIYVEAEQRFSFFTSISMKASCWISAVTVSPFARAAYDFYMGKYTVKSWDFLLKFWYTARRSIERPFSRNPIIYVFDCFPKVTHRYKHNHPLLCDGSFSTLRHCLQYVYILDDFIIFLRNDNLH